jgi:hypothetical protein
VIAAWRVLVAVRSAAGWRAALVMGCTALGTACRRRTAAVWRFECTSLGFAASEAPVVAWGLRASHHTVTEQRDVGTATATSSPSPFG